jgi:hypothetical protein
MEKKGEGKKRGIKEQENGISRNRRHNKDELG